MLVTVGLLVPSQWFAYRLATSAAADERFPLSEWHDPKYFPAGIRNRSVKPISPQILEQIAAEKRAGSGSTPGPTPQPSPQPSPTPSGRRSPQPSPSPTITASPSPSPTGSPSPSPRPVPPVIEIRADHISAPDGSTSTFYRWRVQIENPSDGEWIDDVRTLTQVPHGMERVECGRGVKLDAGESGSSARAGAPGVTCNVVAPAPSDDGHELSWEERHLGPGHVRVYTFEVRVTASNGSLIRNHAHLKWEDGSRTTKVCEFEINHQAPKGCRASS